MSSIKEIIDQLFVEPFDEVTIDGEAISAIGMARWNRAIIDIARMTGETINSDEVEEAFVANGCNEEDAAAFTDEVLANLDLILQYTNELAAACGKSA